jgi:hypothetical protein
LRGNSGSNLAPKRKERRISFGKDTRRHRGVLAGDRGFSAELRLAGACFAVRAEWDCSGWWPLQSFFSKFAGDFTPPAAIYQCIHDAKRLSAQLSCLQQFAIGKNPEFCFIAENCLVAEQSLQQMEGISRTLCAQGTSLPRWRQWLFTRRKTAGELAVGRMSWSGPQVD